MEFKSNLNKLHYNLTQTFENVSVSEKFSREEGNFLEISIKEDLECKIIITKSALESKKVSWKYSSDPTDVESHWVDRTSNLEDMSEEILELFQNKRFSTDYLKKIQK